VAPGESHFDLLTVADSWIEAFYAKKGGTQWSPWAGDVELFVVAQWPVSGQIAFSTLNNGRGILIKGWGMAPAGTPATLFQDSVSIE
jgi:hypothetical protein